MDGMLLQKRPGNDPRSLFHKQIIISRRSFSRLIISTFSSMIRMSVSLSLAASVPFPIFSPSLFYIFIANYVVLCYIMVNHVKLCSPGTVPPIPGR